MFTDNPVDCINISLDASLDHVCAYASAHVNPIILQNPDRSLSQGILALGNTFQAVVLQLKLETKSSFNCYKISIYRNVACRRLSYQLSVLYMLTVAVEIALFPLLI